MDKITKDETENIKEKETSEIEFNENKKMKGFYFRS